MSDFETHPTGTVARLRRIIAELYRGWPEPEIESMDGLDAQEFGQKHGILRHESRTVPCSEHCTCAEVIPAGEDTDCFILEKEFRVDDY